MFKDPIVQQVRDIRKEIEHQYPDSRSFYEHYERLQKDCKKTLTRKSPKQIIRTQAS
jgi:hypothetical protein